MENYTIPYCGSFWPDGGIIQFYVATQLHSTCPQQITARVNAHAIVLWAHACPWPQRACVPALGYTLGLWYLYTCTYLYQAATGPLHPCCAATAAGGRAWLPSLITFNYIKLRYIRFSYMPTNVEEWGLKLVNIITKVMTPIKCCNTGL